MIESSLNGSTLFDEPTHPKYLPKKQTISYVPIHGDDIIVISTKQFERITHTRYLSHLVFDCKATYESVKNLCCDKTDRRREWLGLQYRKEVLGGFVNDVYIKWVDDRFGFGLFANKKILEGEFIGEYVGCVRPVTYFFANINPYCFRYPLYHIGLHVYTIDAQDMFNETSFINHSNTPNCDAVVTMNNSLLHMCVVASSNIEEGEQLTYDYGNNLWRRLLF